jgi:replicative DNA helicase
MPCKSLHEILTDTYNSLTYYRSGNPYCFVTKFNSLNDALGGGIEFGTTMVIGARPGMGKSTIVMQLILDIQEVNHFPLEIHFLNWEMTTNQLGIRVLANQTNMNISKIRSLDTMSLYENVSTIQNKIPNKIYVNDNAMTLQDLDSYISTQCDHREEIKKLFVIDHTRLLLPSDERTEEERLFNLCRYINHSNKLHGASYILLSQLSRESERENSSLKTEGYREPIMADLFGASALEQFAHSVILLYAPKLNERETYPMHYNNVTYQIPTDNLIIGKLVKNRNGPIGKLYFVTESSTFVIKEFDKSTLQNPFELYGK